MGLLCRCARLNCGATCLSNSNLLLEQVIRWHDRASPADHTISTVRCMLCAAEWSSDSVLELRRSSPYVLSPVSVDRVFVFLPQACNARAARCLRLGITRSSPFPRHVWLHSSGNDIASELCCVPGGLRSAGRIRSIRRAKVVECKYLRQM